MKWALIPMLACTICEIRWGGRKRYASRVVTTTLPEVGVKLEFIAKEFS